MLPSRRFRRRRSAVLKSVCPTSPPLSLPATSQPNANIHHRIDCDPTNPLLYTNRGLALLKLHLFPLAITLSQHAISLSPPPSISMKAHFQLAQAQIALHNPSSALESSKLAHKLCIDEIVAGGKGGGSIGPITELVLRCKKELWEQREDERLRKRGGLLEECARGLERERDAYVSVLQAEEGKEEDVERVKERYGQKIEELRRTFELAGAVGEEGKRRKVPDWCLDDITFSVMLDPVVVCSPPTPACKCMLMKNRPGQDNHTTALRLWNT